VVFPDSLRSSSEDVSQLPVASTFSNAAIPNTSVPLGVYPFWDDLLLYIEEGKSSEEIVAAGHSKEAVEKTIALIEKNEYKRRQAPVGLRVTSKAFGTGRRFPIARKL